MPLLSFADARPWSRAIKRAVQTREMPPWFADPAHGRFRNERRFSGQEIVAISSWVDGGSPKGRDSDLPPPPRFVGGWQNGQPDYVIEMPIDVELPAEGQVELQDFFVAVPFAEDRFVEALEIRPSTAGVLIVLRVPKYDFNWQLHYELETTIRIPAGSKMAAIAHYDNSLKNRYNPGPDKTVYWSEQSWDEMNVALIEVSFDDAWPPLSRGRER